jgi:hypothetical protein
MRTGVLPLVCLPKPTFNISSFHSILPHFKANFDADTLFFQVCHFLALPQSQMENMHLHLTRHNSTITCATSLVQAGNDPSDSIYT